jgi:hypothetical protein
MPRKTVATLALGTLTTFVAGAALVIAPLAAAGSATHRLHFKAKSIYSIKIDSNESLSASTLRQRHHGTYGHKVGLATFSCHEAGGASRLRCYTDLTLQGGQMFGSSVVDFAASTIKGQVNDGTGDFKNADGIIKGKLSSRHALVTVVYK